METTQYIVEGTLRYTILFGAETAVLLVVAFVAGRRLPRPDAVLVLVGAVLGVLAVAPAAIAYGMLHFTGRFGVFDQLTSSPFSVLFDARSLAVALIATGWVLASRRLGRASTAD